MPTESLLLGMDTSVPAPAQNTDRQRKILLVEDDDNLANVYLTRLQAEGFDVKRVPSQRLSNPPASRRL